MSAPTPPFAPPGGRAAGPPSGPPTGPPNGPATGPTGGPVRPGAPSTAARLPKLAPATLAGQVVAFAVCVLAVGLLCAWLDQPVAFVVAVAALGGGVAVGLTTGLGLRFTNIAGWVLALAATVATMVVIAILDRSAHIGLPAAVSALVGLFVVGLDWCFVQRLRGAVVLSGLFVVPLLAAGKGWETAAALVWFGGALVAFWFLERDGRAVVPTPEPVIGEGGRPGTRSWTDLVGIIGPALLIGFVAAMLIGNPSCSNRQTGKASARSPGNQGQAGHQGQFGSQGQFGNQGQASSSVPSGRSSGQGGAAGDGAAPLFRLDRNGYEQTVDGNSSGGGSITAPSGETYSVSSEGGQTVVRDAGGNVVARLDGDEVVAGTAEGDTQHYQIDEKGRVFVRGTDGTRYDLEERDGQVVLVDPNGHVVASAALGADHLYVHDPDGGVLVPGSSADGGIPLPNQAVREGLLGQGKTYARDGSGNPVVGSPDGSTRTYSTDAQGLPQVRVDDGAGTVRTYVYDATGGGHIVVRELDGNGNELRRYTVDPDGTFIEGRTASGSGSVDGAAGSPPTPEAASGRAGAPTEAALHRGTNWLLIAGLALGVALFVGLVIWWLRRSRPVSDRTWAEGLVRRIDREGAVRGRPRRAGETIVAYTSELSAGSLPDPRLTSVGRVVSDALFGRHEPTAELRDWAEATLAEIVELHPLPKWTDRFRRGAAPSAAT